MEVGASDGDKAAVTVLKLVGAIVVGTIVFMVCVGIGVVLMRAMGPPSAPRASCLNHLRQIDMALFQYAGEYDHQYPAPVDASDPEEPAQYRFARLLKLDYLNTEKVFRCPSARGTVRPELDAVDGEGFTDSTLGSICRPVSYTHLTLPTN